MNSFVVPFHFVGAFAVTIAALGAVWVALSRPGFISGGRLSRGVFAAGWLAVAGGELVRGLQLVADEPNPGLVALRSVGYVSVIAVWLTISRRGLMASMRLAIALALLIVSEAVFASMGGAGLGDAAINSLLFQSLRLLGGLVLMSWLWQMIRTSIQAKFVANSILLLLVVVVAISATTSQLFASNVAEEALRRAEREAQVQRQMLDSQVAESVSRARQVAELDSVRRAVANREPVLEATVQRLQGPGGPFDSSDFMAFIDPSGAILALSAADENNKTTLDPSDAVSLAGTDVVQSALARKQAGSVDALGPRNVALVGAYPIFNPPGFDPPGSPQGLAGVVALGRVVDRNYLLDLTRDENEHAFLITRTKVLINTGLEPGGVLLESSDQRKQVFDEGRLLSTQGELAGVAFFKSYVPLQQTDNEVVAALVLTQRSQVLDLTQRQVIRTTFLLALAAAAVGIGLSYLAGSRITKPIVELTSAAERVRGGDLSARVNPATPDEVGALGRAFDEMAASVGELTNELRGAAEEESRMRSRLETILQSMSDGLIAIDDGGRIIAFNREAERILGRSEQDVRDRDIREVLVLKDRSGQALDLPIYEFAEGSIQGLAGADSGAELPVAVTSALIRDDAGKVSGAVALLRDLTPEIEVERMKTTFLSNVSHELRTPLTPIKGYSDILRRKQVPRAKAITFLDGIVASADRLERIVEMLIDFSAMEAGRVVPRKVGVDLDKATAELVEKAAKTAPQHKFERKGFSKLPQVEVDEKLVPLAVAELVDNAVKFSPHGGKVVLAAQLEGSGNSHQKLSISVADAGIGIEPERLSTISDNFAQVDGSATRAYGGMGLGLAYVRRIVEINGGRLEVQSTPGKGSRFTLIIPTVSKGRK